MFVMTRSFRCFESLSWPAAAEAASQEGSTFVWPLGACEQHGPHLPLSTDTLFAETIITAVLKKLPSSFPIWKLPTQSIGFSPEHCSFPGTLSLSGNLMFQLVIEVGNQLADIGVKRLVLFNAHGGQIGLLQSAGRELRKQRPEMAVLPCFLWNGVSALKELIPDQEIEQGLHAGQAETSLMLSLAPELVGHERPSDGDSFYQDEKLRPPKGWSLEGAAPCAWLTEDLSKSGVIGDSSESNLSLGKQIENALIDHWVQLLTSLLTSNWPPVKRLEKF